MIECHDKIVPSGQSNLVIESWIKRFVHDKGVGRSGS